MAPSAKTPESRPGSGRLILGAATADPAAAAVVCPSRGTLTSYQALEEDSVRLARLLRAHGLTAGDHLAVLMDNTPAYYTACWAAQRSGLHTTPVNWHLTEDEAAYIVRDCGAGALVASAPVAELAARVCRAAPDVRLRLLADGRHPDFISLDDALARYPAEPPDGEVEGGLMVYSSGTTGRPKGIRRALPERPFGTPGPLDELLAATYGFDADMVYLCPAPLYHTAPLGWTMAVHRRGGTVVLMERFHAEDLLRLIERHRVTHVQLVPTMFVRLLKLPAAVRSRYDLGSLRVAVHAAAPCPIEVKERMLEWWGPIIHEFYAGSEGNGLCTIGPAEWQRHRGSVGRPVLGEVHIVGDDGRELGAGEVGTVYFSGATSRFVYHNDPDRTAAAHTAAGWSTLGDLGYLDDDGYLHLKERRTDLIISGGVNIYPQEVEDVLVMHPAVADAAVVGQPDDEMGQCVVACVEPLAGPVDPAERDALAAELRRYCRERLAHFKCPRRIEIVSSLPRLPNGKLLRRRLLDAYREPTEPGAALR